ncbi:hypothetical protein OIO90_001885 [Microbotryomycetes sp. JL221]|nr:hypothetical protein OIO90_001885 [Microbotryomycetes sp. JL221]
MRVDWTTPRQVLPISGANDQATASTSSKSAPPKRAIALRLTEHVLNQLQAVLNAHKPTTLDEAAALKGKVQIDLSDNPSLIIDGKLYPLTLTAEPRNSELARLGNQSATNGNTAVPTLQPFATVSHKATVKPGGDLTKVGQTLRETREQAEKEREGRKAVLIETTTNRGNAHKRTVSDSRDASPATSRGSSPAQARHASRLTAVPTKTPHGPSKLVQRENGFPAGATTSTASNTAAENKMTAKSARTDKLASKPTKAQNDATSPPASSASPAESTGSSSSSHNQSTSTGTTSISTAASPSTIATTVPPARSQSALQKANAETESVDPDKSRVGKDKAQVKDETTGIAKSETDASRIAGEGSSELRSSVKRPSAPPLEDESEGSIKKRRVLEADHTTNGNIESPAPAGVKATSAASTPGLSPSVSGALSSTKIKKNKTPVDGSTVPSLAATTTRRKRDSISAGFKASSSSNKRKERLKAERWYSSSSDEDADGDPDSELESSHSATASKQKKQKRTNLVSDSHSTAVSVATTSSAPQPKISVVPTFADATVDDFETLSTRFHTLYTTYYSLHRMLTSEQAALKDGGSGQFDVVMTDALVKKLIGMQLELGRIQEKLTSLKTKSSSKAK